jgi:hypothetical protein
LALVVEQDSTTHAEGEGEGVVGDFGGAVVGDVAYCNATGGEGDAVETVVANTHADDSGGGLDYNLKSFVGDEVYTFKFGNRLTSSSVIRSFKSMMPSMRFLMGSGMVDHGFGTACPARKRSRRKYSTS